MTRINGLIGRLTADAATTGFVAVIERPTMTRREAIKILKRMGEEYSQDDIAEIISGDMWHPQTEEEWRHYFSAS